LKVLITSSPETLRWLDIIKSNISREIPSAEYNESKYWASFKSPATRRKFVYLQPYKKQMRLFTKLSVSFDVTLELAPSSGTWKAVYPSIFKIRSEHDVEKAIHLIIESYRLDLKKKRLAKS